MGLSAVTEYVLYECVECGKVSVSIGWLHAHIERHLGWGPFNMLPPPFPGNYKALNKLTREIRVTEYEAEIEPKDPLMPNG